MNTSAIDFESLRSKLVWQMNGDELRTIVASVISTEPQAKRTQAIGMAKLAEELGCSPSALYELKKKGVLDGAIISHIGKRLVFDVDKARELANEYQAMMRANK